MRGLPESPTDLHSQLEARFRGPLMSFFLRRIRNHEDAEDLTQETLLRVFAAARPERIENPESFVFKVAVILLHDRGRQTLRQGTPSFIPIDEAVAGELEDELAENLSPERVLLGCDAPPVLHDRRLENHLAPAAHFLPQVTPTCERLLDRREVADGGSRVLPQCAILVNACAIGC